MDASGACRHASKTARHPFDIAVGSLDSLVLAKREQFAHLTQIHTVDEACVTEVALLLFRLLRQNVTVESVFALHFTRSGKGEPFFGTGISLYFWHFLLFF